MSKKTRSEDVSAQTAAPVRPLVPVLLLAITAASSLLALFQWMELLVVRAGGSTVCGVNEVLDCQKVWDTPFAMSIHDRFGIPVAGLGLVWSLAALAVSAAWTYELLAGRPGAARAAALKVLAFAGLAAVLVFAIVSFTAGAVCLTCLTTYAVVIAYAVVALKLVPGGWFPSDNDALKGGLWWTIGAAVIAYLVLLGPGLATPHAGAGGASSLSKLGTANNNTSGAQGSTGATAPTGATGSTSSPSRALSSTEQQVAGYLRDLPRAEQQMVANAMAMYDAAPKVEGNVPAPRLLNGPASAPVKIVDWVDIRCPHCRTLVETLHEMERVVPQGTMAIEPRNYPLDSECNPYVNGSDGTGVRCLAARALICLEKAPDFDEVRSNMFAAQASLTKDQVLKIASSGTVKRADLDKCIASTETEKKLQEDLAYATRFNPDGTPIVVVNGKPALPFGSFLYALVMTRADLRSPAFNVLPVPRLDMMGNE